MAGLEWRADPGRSEPPADCRRAHRQGGRRVNSADECRPRSESSAGLTWYQRGDAGVVESLGVTSAEREEHGLAARKGAWELMPPLAFSEVDSSCLLGLPPGGGNAHHRAGITCDEINGVIVCPGSAPKGFGDAQSHGGA